MSSLGSERDIIERIRRRLPPPPPSLVIGPGDDAAVMVPERGALQVLTTDAVVEGIHFDRRFSSLADVGYRALAVNASDIAAMGGTSSVALLSFMLPGSTTAEEVDALLDGILEMATDGRIAVAGGNITRSPGPLMVDVTVIGSVRPRRVLTRSGGRGGEALYLTGSIGAATAGLEILQAHQTAPEFDDCVRRHRRPEPRLRIGAILGRTRAASCCMDLSDGLGDAVHQLAEASGTGAVIDAKALPVHPAAQAWFQRHGKDPVEAAIAGGDDYELLFAAPKKSGGRLRGVQRHARGIPITRIGELTETPDVILRRDDRDSPLPKGFSHF